MQLPLTPETARQQEWIPLGPNDRGWLEAWGVRWPEPDQEPAWLNEMNELVAAGSHHMRRYDQRPPEVEEPLAARHRFFKMLPRLSYTDLKALEEFSPLLAPLDTFIDGQRVLHNAGVDVVQLKKRADYLSHSPQTYQGLIDTLNDLGLHPPGIIASIISISPHRIQQEVHTWYRIARLWKWPEPTAAVNKIIEYGPSALSASRAKTWTLARIATQTFAPQKPEAISVPRPSTVLNLYIRPVEETLAAYLEHHGAIQTPQELCYRANHYSGWGRTALLGLIIQHPDDPAVKTYLRHYPIEKSLDPEQLHAAYRARAAKKQLWEEEKYDPYWSGPTALGDPGLPTIAAYKSVIASPELTDEQKQELCNHISKRWAAAARLRSGNITDPDERARLHEMIEAARPARQALVARHLQLVLEFVRLQTADREAQAELVGAGNLALVKAVNRYVPESHGDVTAYIQEAVRRAFASYRLPMRQRYIEDRLRQRS